MSKRLLTIVCAVFGLASSPAPTHASGAPPAAQARAQAAAHPTRIIVRTHDGRPLDAVDRSPGLTRLRQLPVIGGEVLAVTAQGLERVANDPRVLSISFDRPVRSTSPGFPRQDLQRWGFESVTRLQRTSATIGSRWVRESLGLDGSGVGIALVDSGITAWHDDLAGGGAAQRVVHFIDFVQRRATPYDDFGHGTHVAGIVAGSGFNSDGARAGIAPGATIVALKVLDRTGQGYISDVIAAIDYAIEHRAEFNIRVMNLSVAATPTESYETDPLTLAAKRASEAGIVVVSAAGNMGRNGAGDSVYGGITAPGNAPWVITVGASNHNGTADRRDDTIARFSSRGPTRFDYAAKPDIVAPGVGIESLSEAGSMLYATRPHLLLWGSQNTLTPPYFSMSGTSMAAPVVTGTIALMLQANPALTPNAVKGILEYTAEARPGWDYLTQGAGFLNARGGVELARRFADPTAPISGNAKLWGRHIIWGNHRIGGGMLTPDANAWAAATVWGAALDGGGDTIAWGARCDDEACDDVIWSTPADDNIVWGTSCADENCDDIVWGTAGDNIVWGTTCGGADCDGVVWRASDEDNLVWPRPSGAVNARRDGARPASGRR